MKRVFGKSISLSSASILATVVTCFACNGSKFSGNGGGSNEPNPPPANSPLSCAIKPDKLKIGERATVEITGTGSYNGPIEQRVISQSKTQKFMINATVAGAGLEFARADGGANQISADEAGDLVVELRINPDNASADAKCDVAVEGSTVTAPPMNPEKPCEDGKVAVGANIAFLIDNSNSNAATDCPAAVKTGVFHDADTYECGGATARESAVLEAYDVLAKVATSNGATTESMSRLSIAEFPTHADFVSGYQVHTKWASTSAAGRGAVASALGFTRKPFGITPYGSAVTAAESLFSGVAGNDTRAKVAVLVTDGEPTDRDPSAVASAAASLKAKGVEVITVFITNGEKRSSREAAHVSMLNDFESAVVKAGQGHWFSSRYSSFDGYITELLGRNGSLSLGQRVASTEEAGCQGDSCKRRIVEVSDAAGLHDAFQKIIGTRAVQCK